MYLYGVMQIAIKKSTERTSDPFQKLIEEDVDKHFKILTDKHGDNYSVPQYGLWARSIQCGTHESYDAPPNFPMFGPPPKRPTIH